MMKGNSRRENCKDVLIPSEFPIVTVHFPNHILINYSEEFSSKIGTHNGPGYNFKLPRLSDIFPPHFGANDLQT